MISQHTSLCLLSPLLIQAQANHLFKMHHMPTPASNCLMPPYYKIKSKILNIGTKLIQGVALSWVSGYDVLSSHLEVYSVRMTFKSLVGPGCSVLLCLSSHCFPCWKCNPSPLCTLRAGITTSVVLFRSPSPYPGGISHFPPWFMHPAPNPTFIYLCVTFLLCYVLSSLRNWSSYVRWGTSGDGNHS